METLGKKIPQRLTLINIPHSCTCKSKKIFHKYHNELEHILESKLKNLAPTIDQAIHEITSPEETEVCKMPVILELPEEANSPKEQVEEQRKISFSENVGILHLTTPVSSTSANTHDTIEDTEISPKSKHKDHVSILEPSEEEYHSKTIKTILKPSFKESILSFDSMSEEIFEDEATKEDNKTTECIEDEIIQITNKEYLHRYKEILEDKSKIKNMLVIIEEKISASSSGIDEILLKDLMRNMNIVKELFNMVQLRESEIEKIEHVPTHIQNRRKTDLELWIVIQDLSISIEMLPIKPKRPRQILKHESLFDKHQKIKKLLTPRLKTFETIEERLYKISHGQFSSQTEDEEGVYDKYSERDFFQFLPYSDISRENISREEIFREDIFSGDISKENFTFSSSEKSEEYNPFMKQAKHYLETRRIQQFFRFLGAHLVAASPVNPIQYLIDLIHRCLEYRDGRCMPPLLFEQRHIESLYHALDPIGSGEITLAQYCTGMFTLGVPNFTHSPGVNQHLMIGKETFIKDASTKLKEHLDEMLYIPEQPTLLSPGMSSRTFTCCSG